MAPSPTSAGDAASDEAAGAVGAAPAAPATPPARLAASAPAPSAAEATPPLPPAPSAATPATPASTLGADSASACAGAAGLLGAAGTGSTRPGSASGTAGLLGAAGTSRSSRPGSASRGAVGPGHPQRLAQALTDLLTPLRLAGKMDLKGVDQPTAVHASRRNDGAHRQEVFWLRVEEKADQGAPAGVRIGGGFYVPPGGVPAGNHVDRVRGLAAEREPSRDCAPQERSASPPRSPGSPPRSLAAAQSMADSYVHGRPSVVTEKYHHGTYVRGESRHSVGDRRQDSRNFARYDKASHGSAKEGKDGAFRVLSNERQQTQRQRESSDLPVTWSDLDTTHTVKTGPAAEALNALLTSLGLPTDVQSSVPLVQRVKRTIDNKWCIELCYVCADKMAPEVIVEKPAKTPRPHMSTMSTQTDPVCTRCNTRGHAKEACPMPWCSRCGTLGHKAAQCTLPWCPRCGCTDHWGFHCPYLKAEGTQTVDRSPSPRRAPPKPMADSGCQMDGVPPVPLQVPPARPVQAPCRIGGGFLVGQPIPGLKGASLDPEAARAAVAMALLERERQAHADDTDSGHGCGEPAGQGQQRRPVRPSSAPASGRRGSVRQRPPPAAGLGVKGMVPSEGPEYFIALEREREELRKRIRYGVGNTLDGKAGFVMGTYVSHGKKLGENTSSAYTPFRVFKSRVTAETATDLESASSPRLGSPQRTGPFVWSSSARRSASPGTTSATSPPPPPSVGTAAPADPTAADPRPRPPSPGGSVRRAAAGDPAAARAKASQRVASPTRPSSPGNRVPLAERLAAAPPVRRGREEQQAAAPPPPAEGGDARRRAPRAASARREHAAAAPKASLPSLAPRFPGDAAPAQPGARAAAAPKPKGRPASARRRPPGAAEGPEAAAAGGLGALLHQLHGEGAEDAAQRGGGPAAPSGEGAPGAPAAPAAEPGQPLPVPGGAAAALAPPPSLAAAAGAPPEPPGGRGLPSPPPSPPAAVARPSSPPVALAEGAAQAQDPPPAAEQAARGAPPQAPRPSLPELLGEGACW